MLLEQSVFESADLIGVVLGHLDPMSIVALGCINRGVRAAQRVALRGDPRLLVQAAENARSLTKTQMMGWFALRSAEADALPRSQYVRRRCSGGFYYLYRQPAFARVLWGDAPLLTGIAEWEARLRTRREGADTLACRRRKRPAPAWAAPTRRCVVPCR